MEQDKKLMQVIDLAFKQIVSGRMNPMITDELYKKIIMSMCEASFTSGEIKGSAEVLADLKKGLQNEKEN